MTLTHDKICTLSATDHYRIGRQPYPPRLFAEIAGILDLDGEGHLLDLGSGPAQLAIGFAPYCDSATAIDPDAEMLEGARAEAQKAGVKLHTVLGAAPDALVPSLGLFRLVTIGRAFPRMDRVETLRRLHALVPTGGTIAIFGETYLDVPENAWLKTYRALIRQYSVETPQNEIRVEKNRIRDESLFLHSEFNNVTRMSVLEIRRTKIEHIVSRALSTSGTNFAKIGDAAFALADDVRAQLRPFAEGDSVTGFLETGALLASR